MMTLLIVMRQTLMAVALIAVATDAFGQTSLRELARERAVHDPNRAINPAPSPEEYDVRTIEELTRESAVVVTGRLVRKGSYLSAKENYVITDYDVEDVTVLNGRLPSRRAAVPGMATPLIVSVWGGELILEGVRINAVNEYFEAIQQGVPYLVFLRPPPAPDVHGYGIYNGAIFEIASQRTKPLLKRGNQVFAWAADVTLPELIARIQSAGKAR